MSETNQSARCSCGNAPKLIFACSGSSDVGHISDLAARKLAAEGTGKMYCLAGVGGRVSGIIETTKAASAILAIDGCPLDCAGKTLEEAGLMEFEHLRLTRLGMEKGKAPATDERIDKVVSQARTQLTGCRRASD